ncbi:MAG TPA: hypothetical protein VNO43_00230, partial [Candidatus Eisenbacteria bacterium]|nr:hypothetical protein [Candidatus Eisenbacteria bacterium]
MNADARHSEHFRPYPHEGVLERIARSGMILCRGRTLPPRIKLVCGRDRPYRSPFRSRKRIRTDSSPPLRRDLREQRSITREHLRDAATIEEIGVVNGTELERSVALNGVKGQVELRFDLGYGKRF